MVPKHHFLPRGSQGLKMWLGKTRRIIYCSHGIPTRIKVRKLHFGDSRTLPMEKAMAPHSSTLAWKIPWTEEPGRLQSMGSLRAISLSLFTFMQLEKERATHSSVLAWRIPGTGEPAGLPSMGSHRVGHD